MIFEEFIICFNHSGLRVYWQTLECTVMKNEYTELDFQVHKLNKHTGISQKDPQIIAEKGINFWEQANTDMGMLLSLGFSR